MSLSFYYSASVDLETDKKIQDTIASEFQDRTLICIARQLEAFRDNGFAAHSIW